MNALLFEPTPMAFGGGRPLLSRQETAHICGVSLNTVARWLRAGKVRYVKVGERRVMIDAGSLYRFLFPAEQEGGCGNV